MLDAMEPAPHTALPAYLDGLNPAQRQAVETVEGPVLVLAGAGTGKTRVLTTRLVHILMQGRAQPHNLLAVTFTNKAAREMKERIAAMIGPAAESLWLGTFHSLCVRILRRHAELVDLKSGFTILDTDDQIRLLKQVIQAEDVDDKKWPARLLINIIQRWKDRGLLPKDVPHGEAEGYLNGRLLGIYETYQQRLQTLNAVDFGDLLLLCLRLFREHADVLQSYRRLFKYILVDEYQDTNVAQYLWLRLLAAKEGDEGGNICCVGDDDQSIYSWRGAQVENILRFEKDFPGAMTVKLEQNYRSTQPILASASHLIAHNDGRLGKELWTDVEGGDPITIRHVYDGEDEARFVAGEVEMLHSQDVSLNDMAVLVRAGFQTRAFEERFITQAIPYRVVGGLRFYERQEIRDALAYLRLIHQPSDDLAFERIINVPKRGIGKATLQVIHHHARNREIPLVLATEELLGTDEIRPQSRRALQQLLDQVQRWRRQSEELPHAELTQVVLDESGYTEMWQNDKSPEAPGRLENLKELVAAMEEFESLQGFLEHVALVMENNEADDREMVNLMTLHSAKGLEFDIVFLPGWEEGIFPHQRALDEEGAQGLEEERRLAYVGLTRARRKVFISHASSRFMYGTWSAAIPSRFISELPAEHVEQSSEVLHQRPQFNPFRGGGRGQESGQDTRQGNGSWNSKSATTLLDTSAREVGSSSTTARDPFGPGRPVRHQKFGRGVIKSADGDKLEIIFESGGLKRVLKSFVDAV